MNHSLHIVAIDDPAAADPDAAYAGEPYRFWVKALIWAGCIAGGWGLVTLGYCLGRYLAAQL